MADSNVKAPPAAGDVLQALIRTTHHLHRQFEVLLTAAEIPAQLTGPRLRFLIAISEAGQIRMSELGSKIGIQARTVTQFVDALEQEKLLIRLPDPLDRRATLIQLTDIAAPIILKARATMSEASEKILAHLNAEDRAILLRILQSLSTCNKNPSFIEE
jgi:DNA-binding MarR family transcriptional regulator